jgi:hypothetical protein
MAYLEGERPDPNDAALIDARADVMFDDGVHFTALTYAVRFGSIDAAKELLDRGVSDVVSPDASEATTMCDLARDLAVDDPYDPQGKHTAQLERFVREMCPA